ncbi:MAG: winged helix-turn-helix transcriptional regulator [Solirubrobacterales bacterium]|nr:winged helix-turn-helix transcriptional regulator [Solirubrobacterales bacterium]MBV9421703.1 winged helix-turn-helix transcriptional regulator [Solirubrobacterales bacterium]MBV9797699.1 winged helix-turn-helix transcriptional regulator [Solirubrobacterales bacterium]
MVSTTTPGTITLLTRLSKLVYRKIPESQLGMRLKHFMVLGFLAERDGIPQAELGDICGVDANNLVLLLNELEAAGFAERRRDPEDRRRHIVEITETGRTAFRRSELAGEEVEDEVLATLGPDERDTLRRLLAKALGD